MACRRRCLLFPVLLCLAEGWVSSGVGPLRRRAPSAGRLGHVVACAEGSGGGERPISSEWELDCFSRPVLVNGKKLWELLVVDASGQWKDVVTLPANGVNSVAVRKAIEEVISRAPVKPTVIRFFRRQMLNMLTIALNGVAANRPTLRVTPSRATHALYDWLEERESDVYPDMEGYTPGAGDAVRDRMTAPVTASRLPEGLRGEQYAFVTLPLAEVLSGGGITDENVGVGKLINVKPSYDVDALLPGIAILTRPTPVQVMA